MPTYKTIVTDAGAAALSAAIAGAQDYRLTEMAVGDGDGAATSPTASDTELTNELYRGAITLLSTHPEHPNQLIAEFPAPANELAGETLREAGLFDETGTLFAICNLPEIIYPGLEDGGARDAMIRMIFETTNADDVELLIDPNVVLATREWVSQNSSAAAALDGPVVVYPGQQAEYRITNYHAFYTYSLNVPAPHTGTLLGDRVTLNIDPGVAAGTFQLGVTASGFYRAQTLTILDNIVLAPELTSPVESDTVVGFPILRSSAFTDYPSGVDTHINTHWQLASDPTFSTLIIDEISDTQLTSFLVTSTEPDTTYFARVRHEGNDAGWSSWSTPIEFATAAAPWLDFDSDSPIYGLPLATGVTRVLRLNKTDALAIYHHGPGVEVHYVRVGNEGLDLVGTTTLPSSVTDIYMQNRGEQVLFGWTDVSAIYVQLATVNKVLGTVEFIDSPTEVVNTLAYHDVIDHILAMPGSDRFILSTDNKGIFSDENGGTTLRMCGIYIHPETNAIQLGNITDIGENLISASATLIDDLIVTASISESPVEMLIKTWRMPGIEIAQKDSFNYSDIPVTLFNAGGGIFRYPKVQVMPMGDHIIIASQTNSSAGYSPLFVRVSFDGSLIDDTQGIAAREEYSEIQSPNAGFSLLAAAVDTSVLWIGWTKMARLFSTSAGITAEVLPITDMEKFNDTLRVDMTANTRIGAWLDDKNYLHAGGGPQLSLLRVGE